MKKDKEWLITELLDDEVDGYDNYYNGGYEDGLAYALKLAHQLDEPEKVVIPQFVAEAFEKAKGDNWFASQLINAMYESSDEVGYWLEVPSNEKLLLRAWLDGYEIEKVVIPQFVATFIEDSRNKVGCIVTAIWEMYEYEYKYVYEWALEDGNDEVLMKAFVNGYEVEKEKLYVVELINSHLTRCLAYDLVDNVFFISQTQEEKLNKFKKRFTEQEIKNYDERFWPFAVEVAE